MDLHYRNPLTKKTNSVPKRQREKRLTQALTFCRADYTRCRQRSLTNRHRVSCHLTWRFIYLSARLQYIFHIASDT